MIYFINFATRAGSTFPVGGDRRTRRKPTTFGRALTIYSFHMRTGFEFTLLGIELGTLEVKGEWSDHYTTILVRTSTTHGINFHNWLRSLSYLMKNILPTYINILPTNILHIVVSITRETLIWR